MTSLIFGANCSPFVAQYVKNTNAIRFEKEMPEAVQAIVSSHYMDDYVESHDDVETAERLIKEVTYIHKKGGFEIRNWISNDVNILKNLPPQSLSNDAAWVSSESHAEKTLGHIWF